MLFDKENQLSVAQAFTGSATVSTNSYDTKSAKSDMGIGRDMALLIVPTVAAGSGSTHVFDLIQADDDALSTNKEVLASITVLAASLTKGSYHVVPMPPYRKSRRYLGAQNTATGGTTTVTADIYLMPMDEIAKFKDFPKVVNADLV